MTNQSKHDAVLTNSLVFMFANFSLLPLLSLRQFVLWPPFCSLRPPIFPASLLCFPAPLSPAPVYHHRGTFLRPFDPLNQDELAPTTRATEVQVGNLWKLKYSRRIEQA